MTAAAAAPLDRARKLAETASVVAVIATVMILIAALTDVAALALRELSARPFTLDWEGVKALIRTIGGHVVLAMPNFLLGFALLALSQVLDEYGNGRFFTLRASVGVRKAAEDGLWALAFKVALSPTIYGFIMGEHRGVQWQFESFDLGLAAFAAFVAVMGRVLEAAARIKAENDEIV